MEHSVNEIGERYGKISEARNDDKKFITADFIKFAEDNIKKYCLIEQSNGLFVTTWYANDLIGDYIKKIDTNIN